MDEIDKLPTVMTVAETAHLMRIGLNTCYTACRNGEIPCTHIGGRILVMKQGLIDMLSSPAPVLG